MKVLKRVLFVLLLAIMVCTVFACTPKVDPKPNGGNKDNGNKEDLKPNDIKKLANLTNYGKSATQYAKSAVSFSEGKYAGQDATQQASKLQKRIDTKKVDVKEGKSTSSFVKIFTLSTPDGLLQAMADAALTYDEMNKVVEYLYGSEENPDIIDKYLKDNDTRWDGIFSDHSSTWREQKGTNGYFNAGWSFLDDWDMYDRLKNYVNDSSNFTSDNKNKDQKHLAEDNAAWQYRSILAKVYEQVGLSGDAAARTATHMLQYAIKLVEEKSGGKANEAITTSSGKVSYNSFASYCMYKPTGSEDPMKGLGDYETLSYLLSFNSYRYQKSEGLQNCVSLYGYYYDYNQKYYNVSLKNEDDYAKQLKYEKQSVFTNAEWAEYVSMQRNNYEKAYRYSDTFYRDFYIYHFGFQEEIETFDASVYEIKSNISDMKMTSASSTYTGDMRKAIQVNGTIDGLKGQLALSDWTWCYGGSESRMKEYNEANTKYENSKQKNGGSSEEEYEGKFGFEMQQLYLVKYLLEKMDKSELSGALYYNVYAYSANMVRKMSDRVKSYVYVNKDMELGSYYTDTGEYTGKTEEKAYAKGKIAVLYGQTYDQWKAAGVDNLAQKVGSQEWSTMLNEINTAITYDYESMSFATNQKWQEKCERLEDLVIARKWSCCDKKVSEADVTKCPYDHNNNKDGTAARKDYATDHAISLFVSNYEAVLYHIAGQAEVSFQTANKGYLTNENKSRTWTTGYTGDIKSLRQNKSLVSQDMLYSEKKAITIGSGSTFLSEIEKASDTDAKWWAANKTEGQNAKCDSKEQIEEYSGSKITYTYTYTFKGWYLDKDCLYEFSENDNIDVNLTLYAGYEVKKEAKR